MTIDSQQIIAATQLWLEKAVIGLNLCPFARAPYLKGQVHFEVSEALTQEALLEDLTAALTSLLAKRAEIVETTLLIHPEVLLDFEDFNDFLQTANHAVELLGLEGTLQIASFHPCYQFAGTEPDDLENYTNRSPYPILHLLRESSIERAVDSMEDTDAIYEANIAALEKLGKQGWNKLWKAAIDE
ncbi:MAG: DUF1415 domain-containing protein [Marinobacter sp.]|uniref:DUF1415 domain-containing protein n=1 Tax=Marinobacter sp. TaxID=50741 RepID=UPI0034A026E5